MKIGNIETQKGKKQTGYIVMEKYCGPLQIRFPVIVASGEKENPLVVITAAQHGREINGIEVIRRVFEELDPGTMQGTVVAVPTANPLSVPMRKQDYPTEDGRYVISMASGNLYNMNRNWPGEPDGTLTEMMCYTLMQELICKADCVVDLHGWTDNSMSMAWTIAENREILNAFSMPLSLISELPNHNGYLDDACRQKGIINLTAELTPQNCLSEKSVRIGLRGVKNVLKHFNIISGNMELEPERFFLHDDSAEHQLVTEHSGLLSPSLPIGTKVKKGDILGAIYSLETLECLQELTSPSEGLLYNMRILCNSVPSNIVSPGQCVGLVKEIAEIL